MLIHRVFLFVLLLASLTTITSVVAQKQPPQFHRILSARTVYFDNQIGSGAGGRNALARLKKWGKFQLVPDPKQADLTFLLSGDPYRGGNIILSGGQTGSIDSQGHIEEDPIPNYNKLSPTRYAYLTVIDAKTGDNLWSDKHVWGGLLTGFNSVGEHLIGELEKQLSEASDISGLRAVKTVPPTYPEEAIKKHIVGKVVLELVVDKDGAVADAKVLSGPPELLQSAIDAARQFQFDPPQKAPASTKVEIEYSTEGPCPSGRKPEHGEVIYAEKLPMKTEHRGALKIVGDVYQPLPPYPQELFESGIGGELDIAITVDRRGEVVGARVTKPLQATIDAVSLETVKTWKFKVTKGEQTQFPIRLIFRPTCRDSVEVRTP